MLSPPTSKTYPICSGLFCWGEALVRAKQYFAWEYLAIIAFYPVLVRILWKKKM